MRSLEAQPPKLFLDTSTAGIRTYRHYPLSVVPEVEEFVDRYYRRIGTVQRITVYELAQPPAKAG
jgi:hypothetical protein